MHERLKSYAVAAKALALSLALATSLGTGASAQVTVDVGKITCNQFALYYSGKRGNTVVETEKLKGNVKKLRDYCLQNPDANLLEAVETLVQP